MDTQNLHVIGGKSLEGRIDSVQGCKNTSLPLIAASMLSDKDITLTNIPYIADIDVMIDIVKRLGVEVVKSNGDLSLNSANIHNENLEASFGKIRASLYFLGAMLARTGEAKLYRAGGDFADRRPYNWHLDGFKELGAKVTENGVIYVGSTGLTGCDIDMHHSVGTTVNLILASTGAKGITTLHDCSVTPEILELVGFINKMHENKPIEFEVQEKRIKIEGPIRNWREIDHEIPVDRTVFGTYMTYAAMTGGDVVIGINGLRSDGINYTVQALRNSGALVEYENDGIRVQGPVVPNAFEVTTRPYPGFETDMQQIIMAYMTKAEGSSKVTETVFPGVRVDHVESYNKYGGGITVVSDNDATEFLVEGPRILKAPTELIKIPDLRSGAGIVGLALIASGSSRIGNLHILDRGYVNLEDTLNSLGAEVYRI